MLGKLSFTQRSPGVGELPFDPMPFMDEVTRYAYFRLGSREDAEDVAAQVHHAALRARTVDNPRLYLLGIARRKVADNLRRRKGIRFAPLSAADRASSSFSDAVHLHRDVAAVLRSISDDHREVLVLKYVVEMSAEEIATLTGRTPAAVNSLLQRAREAFANAAGDQFQEELP